MITPAEALRLIASEAALLVDVREPGEVAATGRLRLAVNVPCGRLAALEAELAVGKSRPILLYGACSGGRLALAAQRLEAMGYTRVLDLGAFETAAQTGLGIARPGYSAGSFRGSSTAAFA